MTASASNVSTRQRLIDAAVRRFKKDGFRNVGIDQVLTDVGISKTAFYKHFACKEDLMVAVLESQSDWLQSKFLQMVEARGGNDPRRQLESLLDVVEEIIQSEEFQGCIFVNVAMEFPLPHDPAHRAAAENKTALEQILIDIAARGGAADPRALAQEMGLIMEGAYVTHQVTRSPETMDIARRVAACVIEKHLGRARQE